jgi:large subunit ribosomal protein L23
MAARWGKKIFMPQQIFQLIRRPGRDYGPSTYAFRVPQNMTKHDIKEYLTKIYDMDVTRVATMNYEGTVRRTVQALVYYTDYAAMCQSAHVYIFK